MSAFLLFLFLPQAIAGFPCADALERQLVAWHASGEVVRAPGGPHGGPVYRIATGEIGEWVTLHQPRGLELVSVFRTNARETIRLDFAKTCEPSPASILPASSLPPDAYTDTDLKRDLAANERLVVYLWSPHLPLSVEGYHEVLAAATEVGARLVVVVDPAAERGFVERVATRDGIPAGATRPLGSVELLFRDLAVHTPSIVVFSGGRVSAPLPGYRHRDAYRAHLERVFLERLDSGLP